MEMELTIRKLIKEAMINKDKNKQVTYKNILECAQKTAKKTNAEVTDEMIINAVKNEIKQLNDLLAFCSQGAEKYEETVEKIKYCEVVLPQMATEEEIMQYLLENDIDKNMGVCMKALKSKFGANMDGKMASITAKKYIET